MSDRRTLVYLARIASPGWRRLKERLIEVRGHVCEECGSEHRALDVHHLSYDRLGHERMSDLQLLCRDCHEEADLLRAARTAFERGLATYARKKYVANGLSVPADIRNEFTRWREKKRRSP